MQAKAGFLFLVTVFLLLAMTIFAQEGHPVVGSWHGDRGATGTNRSPVTLIMDWDGKEITGLVNPGYEHMTLQNAKLNAKDWTVHFELDSKDSSGKMVRCVVDGKLDKLGSDRRTLTGTWICGTTKHDFKLTRDRDYYHALGEAK
jgi:hypothetical protein